MTASSGPQYATHDELERIWKWNSSVPHSVQGSVHDLVAQLVREQPDAPAVCAYDGQLSYAQLDGLAGKLAYVLSAHGVKEGCNVAIYLKKSMWTPVAMLGVIQAGATAVTLDTTHPTARLESILDQTDAKIILTSPDLRPHVPGSDRCLVLELESGLLNSTDHLHRAVSPSGLVYISFTSGTTGVPKGACISHSNVRSAVHHQGQLLGFQGTSRVLDFVPYSFDVAWSNFLHTICAGGCLCIATEDEMLQDLGHVIDSLRCTLINVTPTVLRTLQPGPTTLETILLSGEPPYRENITDWAHRVRLVNTYGPTECTFKSAFGVIECVNSQRPSIGAGIGTCTWLADPEDGSRLVSIGSVGELLIEGPLVGQGYVSDPDMTNAVFIHDPQWLLQGCTGHSGRRGKLYKTGDLARYIENGKLMFVGRKDTAQVKVRGQRVEIADVEHHARVLLANEFSALVDVVYPKDTQDPCLILFIETQGHDQPDVKTALDDLRRQLSDRLPSFMIPALYFPIDRIPLAHTGKADRHALRQLASAMTFSQLLDVQATIFSRSAHTEPVNDQERKLRDICSDVLKLSPDTISMNDNFLRLGGNSVQAIRVVSAARQHGMILCISDIFQTSTLHDLAMTVQMTTVTLDSTKVRPFSLIDSAFDSTSTCHTVSSLIGVDTAAIEDIFPCTPMQQGLVAMTSIQKDTYILTASYELSRTIDLSRFKLAWASIISEVASLRTHIVHLPGGDLVQVVVSDKYFMAQLWDTPWDDGNVQSMGLGTRLFAVAMQVDLEGRHVFTMQIHHAIFDGWSRSLILEAVQNAYSQPLEPLRLVSFQPFVQYVLKQCREPETAKYWREQLKNHDAVPFPPARKVGGNKENLHVEITDLRWPRTGITPSSILRAVIALLIANYTNCNDVLFGATVSGRQATLAGIDRVAGSVFSTVPVRVMIDWDETAQDLQSRIQQQMIEMHKYEQFGLQNISKAAAIADSGDASLFQLLLVVQHDSDEGTQSATPGLFSRPLTSGIEWTEHGLDPFNSHGTMVVCSPKDSALAIDVNFDTTCFSSLDCERFVEHLEHLLRLLCASETQKLKLRDLPFASEQDLQQILQWNSTAIPSVDLSVVDMIRARVVSQPEALAIESWDLTLTYSDLWRVSSALVNFLAKYDLHGCMIPLCFEKSASMTIAVLAVLRLGATAIPMSASTLVSRARHVQELCDARLAITSDVLRHSSPFTGSTRLVFIEDILSRTESTQPPISDANIALSEAAFVVFTSGTTNSSKGVLWSHRTLSSNVHAAIKLFGLNESSRVFQFAAYDFDVSIVETMAALSAGGCLCVPSQSDLSDRLTDAINLVRANWICLTPSVASLLDPRSLETMRTIVLAGEVVTPATACSWIEAGGKVFNWYGPAEAPVATCCLLDDSDYPVGLIGKSKHAHIWIIDINDSTKLAQVGAIGEICVEGDIVADGYLRPGGRVDEHAAFVPPQAIDEIATRRRDPHHAVYRTGDYAKYHDNGEIIFVGRSSDTWTKVHGRRVHLQDIEANAQAFFKGQPDTTVVAEVLSLADSDLESLALFIHTSTYNVTGEDIAIDLQFDTDLLSQLRHYLTQRLPAYMVPTHFIPLNKVPLGRTSKIDRRRLRGFGATVTRSQLATLLLSKGDAETLSSFTQISSFTRRALRDLWAIVLGLQADQIQSNDHFFRLGSDSITAIRLVTQARRQGLHLTTAQVFQNPIFDDMASVISNCLPTITGTPKPFSLLAPGVDIGSAIATAARLCNVDTTEVENMYPSIALQQGLLALTAQSPRQYVSRSILKLQDEIDISRFERAWRATVADLPILRTRIVDLPAIGMVQVITRDLEFQDASDLNAYLRGDERQPMFLGDALCRATLAARSFILTIHHSVYDGTFLSMLLNKLEEKYFDKPDTSLTPFENFVQYTLRTPVVDSRDFWKGQLDGDYHSFPQLPLESYQPQATTQIDRMVSLEWAQEGETAALVIQSAWAVLAARLSFSTNVIFGTVLNGREVDLTDVEHCAGPTVCTLPVALKLDWTEAISNFHARLRQQAITTLPHQHFGVHNIASAGGRSNSQDLFQTLLVVHPVADSKGLQSDNAVFKARSYGATLETLGTDPFNAHALMVSCWLSPEGLRVVISFDEGVLSKPQVEILVLHFENCLRTMSGPGDRKLGEVLSIRSEELHHFWAQKVALLTQKRHGTIQSSITEANGARHVPDRHDSAMSVKSDVAQRKDKCLEPLESAVRLRHSAALVCGIPEHDIEDVYRCTPLQESLVALSERRRGDYVGFDDLPLASSVDIGRFRDAWEKVACAMPILRTRIIDVPGEGLVQLVVRSLTPWSTASSLAEYIGEGENAVQVLGQPLSRYGLVRGENDSSLHFVLTMHHAVYDGITNMLIRRALEDFYNQRDPGPLVPFRNFINHINSQNTQAELEFWRSQLDKKVQHFPKLSSHRYQPRPDRVNMHSLSDLRWRDDDFLPSTIVRAAWAIVCSRYTNSSDIVFGTIVSGRQAALDSIDRICGPTIAALPVAIRADPNVEIDSFLGMVQTQALDMIPFEHTGIKRISEFSDSAREACAFQSMLVIQPQQRMSIADSSCFAASGKNDQQLRSYNKFNSHALMAVCTLGDDNLIIQMSTDSFVIGDGEDKLLIAHFAKVVHELCNATAGARIADISMITEHEIDRIWQWNPPIEPTGEVCIHDMITTVAQQQPQTVAIDGWNGALTYQELDDMSTSIAHLILQRVSQRNQIIPMCYEKSIWASIAFFGIVKAGHSVLMLEPSIPRTRLRDIVDQVNPTIMLASAHNQELCSGLCREVLVVDASGSWSSYDGDNNETLISAAKQLPQVRPSDTLYVIFTSGSTGRPKGCLISHANMSAAVVQQRSSHRIESTSRVFDFSSYSFDAHHWVLLHTLCAGGTICVPSEIQKQDHLEESLRLYSITDVLLTPATADMINPAAVPTLRNAIIVGDRMNREELTPWAAATRVTYAYGPSECSAWATSWEVPYPVPDIIRIGKGNGQVTWIVDPANPERLCPIGTVGELCLEGPLVGQGYLNDEEGTRSSFIDSPAWLRVESRNGIARSSRLYRTGDLVKYDPKDGDIIFVGRRDAQIKLNGRRIELGEIEQQFLKCLVKRTNPPLLAAEVVVPDAISRPIIAMFLQMKESEFAEIQDGLAEACQELAKQLPSYMLPSTYRPVQSMPLSASGKLDRRKLRDIGKSIEDVHLTSTMNRSKSATLLTDEERKLQQMWSKVLHMPVESISRDSNFFRVTGDSIVAVRLMSLARQQGFILAVSDILTNPYLKDMAPLMKNSVDGPKAVAVQPFSLLNNPGKAQEIRHEIAQQCTVSIESVEDCYPCTAVQKSLLAVTSKRPGDYVSRLPIELAADVDLERLRKAWDVVSQRSASVLRNRVLAIEGEGFVQALLKTDLEWSQHTSISAFLEYDNGQPMTLGTALTRLAFVDDTESGRRLCILIQHHAIYDGISIHLLLQDVSRAYIGHVVHETPAPFQNFVQHILSVNKEKSKAFWSQQFAHCQASVYPPLPHEQYQPQADSTVRCTVDNLAWPKQNVTAAIVVRAAWALLSKCYTDSDDVVFGILSTGRQAPVEGIERMIAPLIAALPVRAKLEPTMTVHALLLKMQKQSVDMIPYEQTDLAEIQRSSEDAAHGARFNTLLIIQHSGQAAAPTFDDRSPFVRFSHSLHDGDLDHFNPHAAMIMCQLHDSGSLGIEINFDSNVLDSSQADLLLGHFEKVLRQICASTAGDLINDIISVSDKDLEVIWNWNAVLPEARSACVHDLFTATASLYAEYQALCSWDGEMTFRELNDLSDQMAKQLLARGVSRSSVIPLCFEKSVWMPVAALAAMKANAACVSMDCTQPEGRLRSIIGKIGPPIVLTSTANEALARRLCGADIVVVSRQNLTDRTCSQIELPIVSPTDLLYVVFTSGSTGEPKGVLTVHENFTTAMTHQKEHLKIHPGTRVFDFVSYSFDVAWSNLLNTLICGGCLCIPSEAERRNDIAGAFNRMEADYSYFTPSVARSLDPMLFPSLSTLAMGGESISSAEMARWRQVKSFIGIYGPAECAQALCITDLNSRSPTGYVGRSFGARCWLIEPGRIDRLAPIGAVGELVIDGPSVATGYWNNPELTKQVFLETPAWLAERCSKATRVYKTGDLLRYNTDGSLTFVGRKDQMVKLRGQRVELSEVEHHVLKSLRRRSRLCDTVAAEIITPENSKAPILAVFITLTKELAQHERLDRTFQLSRALEDVEEDIREVLPQYMIPGAYVTLDEMPMTTTNKIDRRMLRKIGGQRKLEDLARMQMHSRSLQKAPTTEMERRIQQLWSQILGIDPSSITPQSSFLRIGGESLSAMRLVAAARQAGISFTVADIFRNPRLNQLAKVAKETSTQVKVPTVTPRKPFSLLPAAENGHMEFLLERVEPLLGGGAEADDVQDVLPATDFQALAVHEALQEPPGRLVHFILDLPTNVDMARLRWACKRLVEHFDILRTVFVELDDKIWQVQLGHLKPRFEVVRAEGQDIAAAVKKVCEEDVARGRKLGESFLAFMAVLGASKQQKLIFGISHAQFDDFSCGAMLKTLSEFYSGDSVPAPKLGFGDLISYRAQTRAASLRYWKGQLQNCSFTGRTGTVDDGSADVNLSVNDGLSFKKSVPLSLRTDRKGIPLATLFHAACAIVLTQRLQLEEVVFGRLVTGRAMLPVDVQEVVGPCLVEQPIVYRVVQGDDIWEIARRLQRQFIEDSSYEAAGMVEMIREATSWPEHVGDFGWRTAFQQGDDLEAGGGGLPFSGPFLGESKMTVSAFDRPYVPRRRPEIYATPCRDGLELVFEGNRVLQSEESARAVVEGVAELLQRLDI